MPAAPVSGFTGRSHLNHRQVSGSISLTRFPVLVSVTDSDLRRSVSAAGADILFTSADGVTKLNYERELYSGNTGRLIAWVQVPTLSSSTDTAIYIYYGNPAASDSNTPRAFGTAITSSWHILPIAHS